MKEKTQLYRGFGKLGWTTGWTTGVLFKHCINSTCFEQDYDEDNYVYKIIIDKLTDWGLPNSIIMYDVDKASVQRCSHMNLCTSNEIVFEEDVITIEAPFGKKYEGVVKYGEFCNPFDKETSTRVGFYIEWENECYYRKELEYWIKDRTIQIIGNTYTKKLDIF